jgi:hypothetical protein
LEQPPWAFFTGRSNDHLFLRIWINSTGAMTRS